MSGVIRRYGHEIARISHEYGLRCENGVSVESFRVSGRESSVPNGRPQLGCFIQRGLGDRVEFQAGADLIESAESQVLSGTDQLPPQFVIGDPWDDQTNAR